MAKTHVILKTKDNLHNLQFDSVVFYEKDLQKLKFSRQILYDTVSPVTDLFFVIDDKNNLYLYRENMPRTGKYKLNLLQPLEEDYMQAIIQIMMWEVAIINKIESEGILNLDKFTYSMVVDFQKYLKSVMNGDYSIITEFELKHKK